MNAEFRKLFTINYSLFTYGYKPYTTASFDQSDTRPRRPVHDVVLIELAGDDAGVLNVFRTSPDDHIR